MMSMTIGVLALQGGFIEHVNLVRKAASGMRVPITAIEVRTPAELAQCDGLIIPGGESTTISFVAAQSGLMQPLRDFVKYVPTPKQRLALMLSEFRRSPSGAPAQA